jgi:hypothetical protein
MFGNGTDAQKDSLFQYRYEENSFCDECGIEKKLKDFYLQTPSYYRNKASGHYYFCTETCRNKFESTKVCKRCHYSSDLKPIGEFMYCDNYPGEYLSCYEKVLGNFTCDFCDLPKNAYSNGAYILRSDDFENYHKPMCGDCLDPYRSSLFEIFDWETARTIKKDKNNWIMLSEDNTEKLKSMIEGPKFICNKCNKILSIKKGINIINNLNVCNDCENNESD